jgi:hypothetical protein
VLHGKDVDVAYSKVLSKFLPEGTEDNHRKPQSGQPVTMLRFKAGTSQKKPRLLNNMPLYCTVDYFSCR